MLEKQKIVAVMAVGNEASRYLGVALNHLSRWVETVVVLASNDDAFELATSFPKATCYRNDVPDEAGAWAKLWQLAAGEDPDWLVTVNADEIFEDRIINEIDLLIGQSDYDVLCFRVFDFWKSDTHYRTDGPWNPWSNFHPLIGRYKPERAAGFSQKSMSGRFPDAFNKSILFFSDIRVKHYEWAREEEHELKYQRYRERDLKMSGEESARTRSILIPESQISLEEWVPSKQLYFLNKENTGGDR